MRQYGPAVVNVSVIQNQKQDDTGMSSSEQDFMRRFGIPFGMEPHGDQIVHGIGSGFIVKSDGLILTNAHVVANATEVTVKLTDKREFRAKVLGSDKDTDIAVLKIDASDLPTVRIGDANKVQVGDWVLAIGSPFGFENTATAGIVSARARSLPDEGYVPFLQTDVAGEPRQLGRPALRPGGRGHRHQLADLQRLGRLHGDQLRHPHQRGHERRSSSSSRTGKVDPRPAGRHHPGRQRSSWPSPSACRSPRARW